MVVSNLARGLFSATFADSAFSFPRYGAEQIVVHQVSGVAAVAVEGGGGGGEDRGGGVGWAVPGLGAERRWRRGAAVGTAVGDSSTGCLGRRPHALLSGPVSLSQSGSRGEGG